MLTNQSIEKIVEANLEVALNEAKERIVKKYEAQIMSDFREEIAKITLRTEQFFSVQRQGLDVIITLKNKVGSK